MERSERIGQDQDGPRPFPGHCLERTVELLGTARLQDLKLYCQWSGGGLRALQSERMPRIIWVPQDGDSHCPGNRLLEELELFATQVRTQGGGARDVPAGSSEADHEAQLHRIRSVHHDDRDRRRRPLGGKGGPRHDRDNHVNPEAHKVGREVIEALRLPFCIAPLDGEVHSFDVPQLAQALLQECGGKRPSRGPRRQNPDPPHLPRLLRFGNERRGKEHRARASDERATVHQWVPSGRGDQIGSNGALLTGWAGV